MWKMILLFCSCFCFPAFRQALFRLFWFDLRAGSASHLLKHEIQSSEESFRALDLALASLNAFQQNDPADDHSVFFLLSCGRPSKLSSGTLSCLISMMVKKISHNGKNCLTASKHKSIHFFTFLTCHPSTCFMFFQFHPLMLKLNQLVNLSIFSSGRDFLMLNDSNTK